jgi:hypothetical protein
MTHVKKNGYGISVWNIRSLYRAGSLMTVAKYQNKVYLIGAQVREDRDGTEPAGDYILSYGK